MNWVSRVSSKALRARLKLRPPIPRAEVQAFEDAAGVALLTEYVDFLTHIGNGGIYPKCFLQGLAGWCNCHWIDDPKPEISLQTASIVTPGAELAGANWIDRAGVVDWESRFDADEWDPMFGSIAVAEIGCGLFYNLIVNGAHVGRIFAYGDHVGHPPRFTPHTTYGEWIERSLDAYLSGEVVDFLDRTRMHRL